MNNATLLIDNVIVFTNDGTPIVEQGAVVLAGTRIKAVGNSAELKTQYPNVERLDGGGRLLMPGLTNAHMHFYGLYARGLTLKQTAHNFHEILQYLWWALDKSLDLPAVYYSALVPAITAAKHGVTSMIDHHASPNAIAGSLDQIEAALTQVGLRGLLCYEVSDRDGRAKRDAGLDENERYMRQCQAAKRTDPDHLFDGMMGLHASFTLETETLTEAVARAHDLGRGCHIHMLEDAVDETITREKYEVGVVERLAQTGVLSPRSIAAHAIFLEQKTRDLVADSGTIVVHQAQSNMNNAVGRADIFALLDQSVLVGIGTDGMTPDLRREAMTGFLLHKQVLADNNVGWGQFEQMVLHNNYAIWERLTGQQIGQIKAGYLADIILLDYHAPTELTAENFWGHFLFGLVDATVNTTIVNGKIVMHDKHVLGIDEAEIAAKSREVARGVWARYHA